MREHAVLLVAHGSARYADAARVVLEHAAALRAEGGFAEVGVGVLHGAPAAAQALAALRAPVVHVVPFFMEAGWFTRIAVPRALGLDGQVTCRDGQELRYAAPIGTHPAMAAVIEARAQRVVEGAFAPSASLAALASSCRPVGRSAVRHASAGAGAAPVSARIPPALLVVGHGSVRAPGRVTALHGHVARLAASVGFARVEAAFLEEAPFAADVMARHRGTALAVVGCFAGEGGHVRDDLPALIAAEQAQRRPDDPPLLDCGTIAAEPGIRPIIRALIAAAG